VSFKKHAELKLQHCQLVYHNERVRVTAVKSLKDTSMKEVAGEKLKGTVEEDSERWVRTDGKSIV